MQMFFGRLQVENSNLSLSISLLSPVNRASSRLSALSFVKNYDNINIYFLFFFHSSPGDGDKLFWKLIASLRNRRSGQIKMV